MPSWTSKFDAHVEVRPPLDEERLAEVPAKRGVLGLFASGGEPIALLTAADLRAKLRSRLAERGEDERRKAADLRQITRSVCWTLADGHFETDLRYFELARRIWPDEYEDMLDWKPAWFVYADTAGRVPTLTARRAGLEGLGEHLGPFPSGRAARRFIEALHDAVDLCREPGLLRQAPHARPCPYGQMGRCCQVCDGTVPMAVYRERFLRAVEYALGRRPEEKDRLLREMHTAADSLAFEEAGRMKARLARLSELEDAEFAQVRPLARFRFILVQPSGSRRKARPFLVDRGRVAARADLDWPLQEAQVRDLLAKMHRFVERGGPVGPAERWRVGLVAKYLFSGPRRRGAAVHWRPELAAEELAEAVRSGRDDLGLSDRVG